MKIYTVYTYSVDEVLEALCANKTKPVFKGRFFKPWLNTNTNELELTFLEEEAKKEEKKWITFDCVACAKATSAYAAHGEVCAPYCPECLARIK